MHLYHVYAGIALITRRSSILICPVASQYLTLPVTAVSQPLWGWRPITIVATKCGEIRLATE